MIATTVTMSARHAMRLIDLRRDEIFYSGAHVADAAGDVTRGRELRAYQRLSASMSAR